MTTITPTQDLMMLGPRAQRIRAIFDNPPVVFSCLINSTSTKTDKIASLTFDNGSPSGDWSKVRFGMTVLVGSAAGLSDLGIDYIRKAATSSILYIGETSSIKVSNNKFVTVLDDYGIWARALRILDAGTVLMDYDIAYSDQLTKFNPIVNIGTDVIGIKKLGETTVTVSFNGTATVFDSTISTWAWTFDGAASSSNTNTANPSAVYSTNGRHRVTVVVTSALNKSTTVRRLVYILPALGDTLTTEVENTGGSIRINGSSEFTVSCDTDVYPVSQNGTTLVRDRTKVTLVVEDYFGGYPDTGGLCLGPQPTNPHFFMQGWIDGESVPLTEDLSPVSFTVKGPSFWLDKIVDFPAGVLNVNHAPTKWTEMKLLNPDRGAYFLLYWRTNLWQSCDIVWSGTTANCGKLNSGKNSLWGQLREFMTPTIISIPTFDRYNAMHLEVDISIRPVASRSGIPTLFELTKNHYETLNITRVIVNEISLLDLSGVGMNNTEKGKAFFSLAPGHVHEHYGASEAIDKLIITSQAMGNELTGNIYAKKRKAYRISVSDLNYIPWVDVYPMRIGLTIAQSDTYRGIEFTGFILPNSVSFSYSSEAGHISMNIEAVSETSRTGTIVVNGDIPADDPDDPPWTPPPYPPPSAPPVVIPTPPALGLIPILAGFALTNTGVYATENVNDVSPLWYSLNGAILPEDLLELTSISCYRIGNYLYASHPKAFCECYFEFGTGTSRFIELVTLELLALFLPSAVEPTTYQFMDCLGTHPYTNATVFVGNVNWGTPLQGLFYTFNLNPGIIGDYGVAMNSPNYYNWPGRGPTSYGGTEFCMSGGAGVYFSSDHGATTTRLQLPIWFTDYCVPVRAGLSDKGGITLDSSFLARTIDGFHTFTNLTPIVYNPDGSIASGGVPTTTPLYNPITKTSFAFNTDGSLGLGTVRRVADGKYFLAQTLDVGLTWVELEEQVDQNNPFVAFRHISGTCWLWGDKTHVYASTNEGVTYRDITGNLTTDFGNPTTGRIDLKMLEFMA